MNKEKDDLLMKLTGNKDYNAGMLASLLIIDDHIEELRDESN